MKTKILLLSLSLLFACAASADENLDGLKREIEALKRRVTARGFAVVRVLRGRSFCCETGGDPTGAVEDSVASSTEVGSVDDDFFISIAPQTARATPSMPPPTPTHLLNEAARRGGRRAWLRGMAWLFIAFIGGFRSESQARALVGVPGK